MKNPKLPSLLVAGLMLSFSNYLYAQLVDLDPNWVEIESTPPVLSNPLQTILFELTNSGSELKWGIEPSSISIGSDGVTRYVVVATGSNISNITFEGINCQRNELKVYARWNGKNWNLVKDANWINLQEGGRSRHALALARQGLCDGNSAHTNVTQLLQKLKTKSTGRTSYKP